MTITQLWKKSKPSSALSKYSGNNSKCGVRKRRVGSCEAIITIAAQASMRTCIRTKQQASKTKMKRLLEVITASYRARSSRTKFGSSQQRQRQTMCQAWSRHLVREQSTTLWWRRDRRYSSTASPNLYSRSVGLSWPSWTPCPSRQALWLPHRPHFRSASNCRAWYLLAKKAEAHHKFNGGKRKHLLSEWRI